MNKERFHLSGVQNGASHRLTEVEKSFDQLAAEEALHRTEALLEARTRQLEEAVHELEGLSYAISHDLRAPIRHIDGFVDLLRRSTEHELSEDNRQMLNIVSEASKLVAGMVEGLLSLSRLSRAPVEPVNIDMTQMVQQVVTEISGWNEEREIVWMIQPLPRIKADRILLRQVWALLISNAVKFTNGRNETRIEIGATEDESETVYFVRDNGVGFDSRYASKLFAPFQKLHATGKFEGLGMGLACVRRIVARHGGRVWAEAALDEGATFYFSIPKKLP